MFAGLSYKGFEEYFNSTFYLDLKREKNNPSSENFDSDACYYYYLASYFLKMVMGKYVFDENVGCLNELGYIYLNDDRIALGITIPFAKKYISDYFDKKLPECFGVDQHKSNGACFYELRKLGYYNFDQMFHYAPGKGFAEDCRKYAHTAYIGELCGEPVSNIYYLGFLAFVDLLCDMILSTDETSEFREEILLYPEEIRTELYMVSKIFLSFFLEKINWAVDACVKKVPSEEYQGKLFCLEFFATGIEDSVFNHLVEIFQRESAVEDEIREAEFPRSLYSDPEDHGYVTYEGPFPKKFFFGVGPVSTCFLPERGERASFNAQYSSSFDLAEYIFLMLRKWNFQDQAVIDCFDAQKTCRFHMDYCGGHASVGFTHYYDNEKDLRDIISQVNEKYSTDFSYEKIGYGGDSSMIPFDDEETLRSIRRGETDDMFGLSEGISADALSKVKSYEDLKKLWIEAMELDDCISSDVEADHTCRKIYMLAYLKTHYEFQMDSKTVVYDF